MIIPRARQFLYAAIAIVLFFGLAEGVSRLLFAAHGSAEPIFRPNLFFFESHAGYLPDDHLFWRMAPSQTFRYKNGQPITTNRYGLRDDDFPLAKPPGEIRILSLGESGTFGEGVASEETYSQVLEKLLHARFSQIEFQVINAGVSSYTSYQGMTYLRREGLKFAPDLVLVYFSGNDLLPSYFVDATAAGEPLNRPRYGRGFTDREIYERRFLLPGWSILRRSALVRTLASLLFTAERKVTQRDPFTKLAVRVPDEDRRYALGEIIKLSRGAGAKVLLLIPPYGQWDERDRIILEVGRDRNAPVLDLKQARLDYDDAHFGEHEMSTFFLDPMHPSALGHRVCAEAIAQAILAEKLLPHGDAP